MVHIRCSIFDVGYTIYDEGCRKQNRRLPQREVDADPVECERLRLFRLSLFVSDLTVLRFGYIYVNRESEIPNLES